MITKDFSAYAKREWSDCLTPVTQLSGNHRNGGEPLVRHEAELYDFDKICDALFAKQKAKKPTSADALDISSKVVRLVEFKSGFRDKIGKENFDKEKAKCEAIGGICEDYWKLYSKLRKAQTHELYDSIRAKALEGLFTLEKQILPLCEDSPCPIRLFYVVVIDANPTDKMEDILTDLGTQKQPDKTTNPLTRIHNALNRLTGIQDASGNTYSYDEIEVLSPEEYAASLDRRT